MVEQIYNQYDTRKRGFLNCGEFKIFIASVFDLQMRRHVDKDHYRRILAKLGKSDFDCIPKDLIVDFLIERGAQELRKAVDNIELVEDESFIDNGGLQSETLSYFDES